jgi:LysR family transcriptional activator of nhaA
MVRCRLSDVAPLNYHHLQYFWMVAREGGLAPAAEKLGVSPPTVSAQIKALEAALGEALFQKQGRRLALTERGHVAYRYAEEIFSLGSELSSVLGGSRPDRPAQLVVGVAQSVPKLVVRRILAPVERMRNVQLVCREEPSDQLLAELAVHKLDVVLADTPGSGDTNVKVFSHLLGESATGFFGAEPLVERFRAGFPGSLDGAPFLLPTAGHNARRSLDAWFDQHRVRPAVAAEFDDSALLKAFAQDGLGLFAAPAVIRAELRRQYGVLRLAVVPELRERYYAITSERRVKHPALLAITEAARERVFRATGPTRR